MRNYIITTESGTRCLVRHSSEQAALKAWDKAALKAWDKARTIEPAGRSEARRIAKRQEHDYRNMPRFEVREMGMPAFSTCRTLHQARRDLVEARRLGLKRAQIIELT